MATNDGGPAFPETRTLHVKHTDGSEETGFVEMRGMTLRDYFAATVMGSVFALCDFGEEAESYAKECYRYADAMLAAREDGK